MGIHRRFARCSSQLVSAKSPWPRCRMRFRLAVRGQAKTTISDTLALQSQPHDIPLRADQRIIDSQWPAKPGNCPGSCFTFPMQNADQTSPWPFLDEQRIWVRGNNGSVGCDYFAWIVLMYSVSLRIRSSAWCWSGDGPLGFHEKIGPHVGISCEPCAGMFPPALIACTTPDSGNRPPFRTSSMVKSVGGTFKAGAVGPFPLPDWPWHAAQYSPNNCLPDAPEAAFGGLGLTVVCCAAAGNSAPSSIERSHIFRMWVSFERTDHRSKELIINDQVKDCLAHHTSNSSRSFRFRRQIFSHPMD